MENTTEKIDRYIQNDMTAAEKTAFENELNVNAELREQYLNQLNVVKGIRRSKLEEAVKTSVKRIKTVKKLVKAGVIISALTLVAAGVYFVGEKFSKAKENNIRYELNEEGNKNWSVADKVLEAQVFNINPTKDTVIETKGGIIFSIPANIFLNQFGETEKETVEIEIKEALTAYDIIRAGLSTTSNGNLLETGGMFYFNARNSKANLDIDKHYEVGVAVPYAGKKEMMLFDGERKSDGSINWINPKPTKKQLTTVDILSLNFYPPNYLDSLNKWGYNSRDKAFTDSLYYSFICNSYAPLNSRPAKDSTSIDGEKLFRQNCAVCHSMTNQKLTGPGMAGIEKRAPRGNWLFEFIKNNEKVIKSGDEYANKIYWENGNAAMTVFEGALSDNEIHGIVNYITSGKGGFIIPESDRREIPSEGEVAYCSEINPSRIKVIWDAKFNNTILATKEFEERLKVIFTTCDDRILNLYVMNLDKELYQIDSVAAIYASGAAKQKFEEFYKRGDGGISITKKEQQMLAKYREQKKRIYEEAAAKAFQKYMKEEAAKDEKMANERNEQFYKDLQRNSSNYQEEFNLNLKEAYRQLGKEEVPLNPNARMLTTSITTTGWKNVDQYVAESLASRTSLNYTDERTGKTAVIKYEPLKLKVNGAKYYDRVVAYLLPDKLNSFQLMNKTNDEFSENLNELITYNLAIVGFKGNKTFYYEEKAVRSQTKTIELKEVDENYLVGRINGSFTLSQQNDFLANLDYQKLEVKEIGRQKKIKEDQLLRDKLYYIIYPCYGDYASEKTRQDSIMRADSIANAELAKQLILKYGVK